MHHHAVAVAAEGAGRCGADAGAGAGDQHHLALEVGDIAIGSVIEELRR
jgi:hypothetical protein